MSGERGGIVTLQCVVCVATFETFRSELKRRNTQCCSRACYFMSLRSRVTLACEKCGDSFVVMRHKHAARFCSVACKVASQRKQKTPEQIAAVKLDRRMSATIWLAIRQNKSGNSWKTLVDYTLADLMAHLEARFAPGMTWANIGEWHIDHRRPRSSFAYSSPDDPEFKNCWALHNLQPLWAADNLAKGARMPVAA
jgi:hypothetical protein